MLAPPGAGLPKFELAVVRFVFWFFHKRSSPAQVTALFAHEQRKILEIVKTCDPVDGARQVLIERLKGLEDSSRYWSVFMTLEHLRIVNSAIAGIVAALTAGENPPGVASTAAVKPSPTVGPEVVENFLESCLDYQETTASCKGAAGRFPHPWFGPLDAWQWQSMAAFHMRLHRQQIEKILQALAQAT